MIKQRLTLVPLSLLFALGLVLVILTGPFNGTQEAKATPAIVPLIGTFILDDGVCGAGPSDGVVSGSYFAMTDPTPLAVINVNSPCNFKGNDPLAKGTDGGLRTGVFQAHAVPPFSGASSLSDRIHQPHPFFSTTAGGGASGTDYGSATLQNPSEFDAINTITETFGPVPAPSILWDTTTNTLSGDLSAYHTNWNIIPFIQGNPRADAGDNCADDQPPVSGTFDPTTGSYTLDWSSRIGGSFGCGFIGFWHFEGNFEVEKSVKEKWVKQLGPNEPNCPSTHGFVKIPHSFLVQPSNQCHFKTNSLDVSTGPVTIQEQHTLDLLSGDCDFGIGYPASVKDLNTPKSQSVQVNEPLGESFLADNVAPDWDIHMATGPICVFRLTVEKTAKSPYIDLVGHTTSFEDFLICKDGDADSVADADAIAAAAALDPPRSCEKASHMPLVGTFKLDPGVCGPGPSDGVIKGSYFAMTDATPNPVINVNSACNFKGNDPLTPGTDGGLLSGVFQPHAAPPFSGASSLSDRIHEPHPFFSTTAGGGASGTDYGSATLPQPSEFDAINTITETFGANTPTILWDPLTGTLSGDLSAYHTNWNNIPFIQGQPRADAGDNCADDQPPVSGTFDPFTGRYTLDWSSRIGGSFGCGFIGFWHFEGNFKPAHQMVGTLHIDPGVCGTGSATGLRHGEYYTFPAGGVVSGSYFAMSGANDGAVVNTDSECTFKGNDPLLPGTDGGLRLGFLQPESLPPFDGSGSGSSGGIHVPRLFFGGGVKYGSFTANPVDETEPFNTLNVITLQPSANVPVCFQYGGAGDPVLDALTCDISHYNIGWNFGKYLQGWPRPVGSFCTDDQSLYGTIDPVTGDYTLDWSSRIGGAFGCGFTGSWHFVGQFWPQFSECTDPNYTSLPWNVPSGDQDCDGFSDAEERKIGTKPWSNCAVQTPTHDEFPDPWPPDYDDNGIVLLGDILAMKNPFLSIEGNPTSQERYQQRMDLIPSGSVLLGDILKMKDFFLKSC